MKKIILSIAVLSLALSSCDDFLTKEPKQNQSDELALATFSGIDEATAGNYVNLRSGSWYGSTFPVTFDVMCGNCAVGPINTGRMRSEVIWNYNPNSTLGLWAAAYNMILGCNRVLAAIDEGTFNREGATDEQINSVKAENLFLRAIAYFDLVRVYAQPYGYIKANGITGTEALGVPIIREDDLSARPARNTVAEVYEQLIIPDLQEAERLMSTSYERANVKDRKAAITVPVIQALMARVYQYHEDWQLAADYATKVINNGSYRLLSGNNFVKQWDGTVSGDETIFKIYIVYGESSNDIGGLLTVPEYDGAQGYGDVRVSNDLIELFDPEDVRYTDLMTTNSEYQGYYWSKKYPGKDNSLNYNDVPIFRISEMYLIRSEAIFNGAKVSGVSSDVVDLNRVATSRGANSYQEFSVENLFKETRREFFLEGHIFFDMKRLQLSLTREDHSQIENQNLAFPGTRWALPIPQHEILNNKNMVQNPGYNVQ